MSKPQIDEVAGVLDEQNQYDPWRTLLANRTLSNVMPRRKFSSTLVDATLSGDVMMEIDGESHLNDIQDVCSAHSRKDTQEQSEAKVEKREN